jgi:flagellar hook-length control protein FliK
LDEAKGAGGLVQPLSAKLELTSLEQSTAKPTQEPPHPNAQASVLRATMALNMRDTQWGQKLVAQIEKMQNEGVARYDISLRPKNLGDLQVSLEFRGEDTHVRIVTETTSASRVLIGAEDRLAQMLDNAGFRLTSFAASMSAGQQSAGTGLGQNAKQKQNSAELANKNKGARNASASSPVASAETKSHNGAVNVIA